MEIIEEIIKTRGSELAFDIKWGGHSANLPTGGKMLGLVKSSIYCFVEGYRQTVFVMDHAGTRRPVPVAYDFREFVRLILAVGSADTLAQMALERSELPETVKVKSALDKFRLKYDLEPISDPAGYLQTIKSVIDCSRI